MKLPTKQFETGELDLLIPESKYCVAGGVVVHDGTRFLQGLSDTMLTTIDTDIWDSDSNPDPTHMTITAGASGTTFDADASAATGHLRSIWTMPAALRGVPITVRYHVTLTNYADDTSAGIEIDDGTRNITSMLERKAGVLRTQIYRSAGFGSAGVPGGAACWICFTYNPVTGELTSYFDAATAAVDDPGWLTSSAGWTNYDSSTVSYANRPRGAVLFRRYMYQNHAGQATAILRGAADGFLKIG